MKYDVIIIGGGIGGLTSGALLVRHGLRVLILERGARTGGYVTSFNRGGLKFDATGAFVGGCEEGGEFSKILVQTGAQRHLRFLRVEAARNIYPDFSLDLHLRGGFEEYIKGAKELFPEERRALRDYFNLIGKVGEEINRFGGLTWWRRLFFPVCFRHLILYQRASLGRILHRYFQGEGIKLVLSTLPSHLPPSRLSFLFTATLITKVLAQGVWYPQGGMGAIPQALEAAFSEGGGEVNLETEVEGVEVKGGRVKGVFTRAGNFIPANTVVAAINIRRALGDLLPEEYRSKLYHWVHALEYSLSSFLVYLGVEMDLAPLALPYLTYLSSGNTEMEYEQLSRGEIPDDPTVIITIPTLLDPSLAPRGHHILRLITPAPYGFRDGWGGKDRSLYLEIKDEITQRLIRTVEARYIPGLTAHIKFVEAATPLTLERYTANEGGATYGLAPTPWQFGRGRPANRTPIKGLYLAGHYTRPSHGIVGAAISGSFVAEMIIRERGR
ncbi:MAG: NAD(P)/FAD-dependent oxidoreductase [Deltaproteobacteria bacterium]|nr:NAD(P)/FAD-dependent oxidoreductase [Deltaproteobacteria bacterium]